MPDTVLITGANGLMGHSLLNRLVKSGTSVMGLVRPGSLEKMDPNLRDQVLSTSYDLQDIERVQSKFSKVAEIVHCAGHPAVFASIRSPALDHKNNFDPILFVLELARQTDAKVTLISSAEVYGDSKDRSENAIVNPVNFYGLNKLFGEQYLSLYHKYFSISYMTLRPSIVFGKNLTRNLIYDLWTSFQKRGEVVRIFCTLDSQLDFVNVEDVWAAREVLHKKERWNETWNVSSGQTVTVQELVNWFCEKYKWNPKIEVVEQNRQYKALSSHKLNDLGWRPNHEFYDYLENMVGA